MNFLLFLKLNIFQVSILILIFFQLFFNLKGTIVIKYNVMLVLYLSIMIF